MIVIDNIKAQYVVPYEDGLSIMMDLLPNFAAIPVPKDECPLWMFARMDGCARKLSNVTSIYALILDYDGGITPQEFCRQYPRLEYYWYTSTNHLKDGVTHKFKVVLPLAEEIPFDAIYNDQAKAALLAYFPGHDPSSLTNYQARPNGGAHYEWGFNVRDTVRYSLDMVTETINRIPELQLLASRRSSGEIKPHYDPDPVAYINRRRHAHYAKLLTLPRSAGEASYHHYLSLVGSMLSANCNGVWCWQVQEVYDIVVGHRSDKSITNMIRDFASRREQFPPDATKPTTKTFATLGGY